MTPHTTTARRREALAWLRQAVEEGLLSEADLEEALEEIRGQREEHARVPPKRAVVPRHLQRAALEKATVD